ncbi:MAG: putative Ig domain-containing protein [Limisphaerales bacterium]
MWTGPTVHGASWTPVIEPVPDLVLEQGEALGGTSSSPDTAQRLVLKASGLVGEWHATGLPAALYLKTLNLSVGQNTAELLGSANDYPGEYTVVVTASNMESYGQRVFTITLRAAIPKIKSPTNAAARVGEDFNYQVKATYHPIWFEAAGLPAGLTINRATGVISGRPTQVGVFQVILSADSGFNVGTATLELEVQAPPTLRIKGLFHHYSTPYLLDFAFSLSDGQGRAVTTDPSDLGVKCLEDGREISVTETAFLLARNRKPLECQLVLDYTGSLSDVAVNGDGDQDGVSDAVEAMEAATLAFINGQPGDTQLGLYEFHREDQEPQVVQTLTGDKTVLSDALGGLRQKYVHDWHASSRCWDATMAAVQGFSEIILERQRSVYDEQRCVFLLSDGNDESSTNDPSGIVAEAMRRRVAVYVMGFGAELNEPPLQAISEGTGGRYYQAADADALGERFEDFRRELESHYLLRWSTLQRPGSLPFNPTFEIRDGELVARSTGSNGSTNVRPYNAADYAGTLTAGLLRLMANAEENPTAVTLRAVYVPRFVRRLRVNVRASEPFTVELMSSNRGELLEGWTLSETPDGEGGRWIECVSPSLAGAATRMNSLPYGAMGNLVKFRFQQPIRVPEVFSRFEVDNTVYQSTGGQSFAVVNFLAIATFVRLPSEVGPISQLTFGTVTGSRYQVEFSTQLPLWTPLGPPQHGTGGNLTVLDPVAPEDTGGRLYRVRLE